MDAAPFTRHKVQPGAWMRNFLQNFEKIICAILLLLMTFLGFANVVARYGTNYSFAATEELLTNGFLILTVFGAAIAARRGEHLAVTLVQELMPRPVTKAMFILSAALSVALLVASAWYSWVAMMNFYNNGMRSYGLGIPAWYYQAALPFGFALIILRYLQYTAKALRAPDASGPVVPDV